MPQFDQWRRLGCRRVELIEKFDSLRERKSTSANTRRYPS
jgi:hypothetical protein